MDQRVFLYGDLGQQAAEWAFSSEQIELVNILEVLRTLFITIISFFASWFGYNIIANQQFQR